MNQEENMETPPEFVEHQPTYQTRKQRKRDGVGGTFYEIDVHRYVCSCGRATTWNEDLDAAKRAADRHALPGQMSIAVD